MKVYRYYCPASNGYLEAGFIIRLDDIMRFTPKHEDEAFKLLAFFEDNLKAPPCELYWRYPTAKTYFTAKGNRKFKKVINKIRKYLLEVHHQIMCYDIKEIGDNDEILYEDEYQVLIVDKNKR